MNAYTHLAFAELLKPVLRPDDEGQYSLGAVIPDIRHVLRMRRTHTHLPPAQILEFARRYPEQCAFIAGYAVHCALDDQGSDQDIFRTYPLRPFKRLLPRPFAPALLELYYLEKWRSFSSVSAASNPMLAELGIQDGTVTTFAGRFNQFLAAPSLENELAAFSGLSETPGKVLRRKLWAGRQLLKLKPLWRVFFVWMKIPEFERHVTAETLKYFHTNYGALPGCAGTHFLI